MEIIKENLPVTLTEEEIMDAAKSLVVALTSLRQAEDDKKEADANFNAEIKTHKSTSEKLRKLIANGYEYREVECRWDMYNDRGIKKLIRMDTGEIVRQADMTDADFQAKLGMDS